MKYAVVETYMAVAGLWHAATSLYRVYYSAVTTERRRGADGPVSAPPFMGGATPHLPKDISLKC